MAGAIAKEYSLSMMGGESGDEKAYNDYNARVSQIATSFGSQVEAYLAPAFLWPYLDPENKEKPRKEKVFLTSGPFGGTVIREDLLTMLSHGPAKGNGSEAFRDDPKGEPVTAIFVRSGSLVDGVQLTYGKTAGQFHGGTGGNPHALTLEPGESVSKVDVRANDLVDSIVFTTNKGKTVGGGGGGGYAWVAEPCKDIGAVLVRIEGSVRDRMLEKITLLWRYVRDA